jgi:signal transduction histidine kinase
MTLHPEPTSQRSATPPSKLANRLQRVREQERAHLARELHDELGAILLAAKLDIACLRARLGATAPEIDQRLAHLSEMLNSGLALKTKVVEGLYPSTLASLGLAASLELLAREFGQNAGIPIDLSLEEVSLDTSTQLVAYRLVQECLTNVGKYAEARHARIVLVGSQRNVMVAVVDDGVGFDAARAERSHHGLAGMRRRVEMTGGRLTVTSIPGKGTRVAAVIPKTGGEAPEQGVDADDRAPGRAEIGVRGPVAQRCC